MANTLTDLIPTLYDSLDVVSRELIGFIPNVMRDSTAEQAAVGQTVRSPVVPQNSLEDITPGNDPADSGDQTIGSVDVSITKSKAYPIRWTGEEQLSVSQNGVVNTVLRDQFTQGFRTLANAVEVDLGATYAQASRAYGTAGTTPFASADDNTDLAELNRILDENGAPALGRACIINSAARAKMEGKQSHLFKANEAGDAAFLRSRQAREILNFTMGYSAGVASHTKGTGTGYDANGGEPVGESTIVVDGGDSGTILAGDVVTFAGDSNKYIVASASASGAASGNVVIGAPGLKEVLADTTEMTIGNSYAANMAFSNDAIVLAARQPAMPSEGDAADDVITIQDPVSGLVFQVALYKQYRRIKYEIGLAWGVKCVKPEHCALLLG